MPARKPVNRLAPRVPPVKYFAILHGSALMVGTDPGPGGDDFGRTWTMLNKAGRILSAHGMAARYFLFGESGCEQIGAKAAAKLAVELGGSLEALVTRESWRRSESKAAIPGRAEAFPRRKARNPRSMPLRSRARSRALGSQTSA